jgi:hypothetical protein
MKIYDLTTCFRGHGDNFIISVNFHSTIHSAYKPESMDYVKTFDLLLCLEGGRFKARAYNQICV